MPGSTIPKQQDGTIRDRIQDQLKMLGANLSTEGGRTGDNFLAGMLRPGSTATFGV
jgi:hypothetical protein